MRAAIYARVSTRDQKLDMQLEALREYASRRGFEIVEEFTDTASGARADRERLGALMAAARRRDVDVVLVWKFDRFARSLRQLSNALDEFQALGVAFVSITEGVDTTTPAGALVFGVLASIAQFERGLISERVRAGMARAKAHGARYGRPALHPALVARIAEGPRAGESKRAFARRLDLAPSTIRKYLEEVVRNA